MQRSAHWLLGVVLGSLLLGGCTSKITQKEQYSGFLPSYQNLKETTSSSGEPVLRWVAKGFRPEAYNTVVFDHLELFPAPKPSERVNMQTLQELQAVTSANVKSVLGQRYTVVPTVQQAPAGSRTLVMHAAITGVSASTQGMRWYEVLPVAVAVGAVAAATGERDQDTLLYLEADLVDASTGQPVAQVVRKVFGKSLDDDKQAITANDFKAAIKALMADMQHFIQ